MDHDHSDRDAVVRAFALSTPYHAAQILGLQLAAGSSPRARDVRVCCPWHAEKTPACSLSIKRGFLVAYCHACHEGGGVLEVVAAVEGMPISGNFRDVLRRAGEIVGVDIREAKGAAAGPDTIEKRLHRELAAARAEARSAEKELREVRERAALEQAELLCKLDAHKAAIDGLSDMIVRAQVAACRTREAATAGRRPEVIACIDAIGAALGLVGA